MKKIIAIGLLSLSLAMPAHAVVVGIFTGGVAGAALAASGGGLFLGAHLSDGDSKMNPFIIIATILLERDDYYENSNRKSPMVKIDVNADVDELVSAGLYSMNEGEALKAEFALGDFSVRTKEIKDMTSDEAMDLIQEKSGCSELLAGYLASKVGL